MPAMRYSLRARLLYALTLLLSAFSVLATDNVMAQAQAPTNLQGSVFTDRIDLTWNNSQSYDAIEVWRAGESLVTLASTAESFSDAMPPLGFVSYEVRAIVVGSAVPAISIELFRRGSATDLLWVPSATFGGSTDSGRELDTALLRGGRAALRVDQLPNVAALLEFEALWVTLGTFPFNHVLSGAEGSLLAQYLQQRPNAALYLEGGDTWVEDPVTAVHASFDILGVDGGSGDLTLLQGDGTSCVPPSDVNYAGENQRIDRLQVTGAGVSLLENVTPPYVTTVLSELPNGSRTIGASLEFGALAPASETLSQFLGHYFDCLGLSGSPAPIPPPPPPAPAMTLPIVDVQSGTAVSDSSGVLVVDIAPVDPTRAFLLFQTRHDSDRPTGSMLRGELAAPTELHFIRETDQNSPITIQWYVVHYSEGVKVQRGSATVSNSIIAIEPVAATSRAFVTWSQTPGPTDGSWGSDDPVLIDLVAPDLIDVRVNSAVNTHAVSWQIVEFTEPGSMQVQRGSSSLSPGVASVDIVLPTVVDPARSFVLVGYRQGTNGTANIGARLLRARLLDGSTLNIDRSLTSADITEINWQVVELFDGTRVQHGNSHFPLGVDSYSEGVAALDIPSAAAFATVQPGGGQNHGRTPYAANDILGVSAATLEFTETLLLAQRDAVQDSADVAWQIVEWGPRPPQLLSVTPTSGSPQGGTAVTLLGERFRDGATVTFGGVSATAVTVVDAQTVTATTPSGNPGMVDIVVTDSIGSSTLPQGFEYDAAPTLLSAVPSHGSPLGTTSVELVGNEFTTDTSVTFGGVAAASVIYNGPSSLTVLAPQQLPGVVDITVSSVNGTAVLDSGFEYDAPPAIVALAPDHGSPLGGTSVTVTGLDFTADASVSFGGVGAATVTFVNETTLIATTPALLPVGVVDVELANVNGSSIVAGGFTVDAPATIASLSPSHGSPLGGTSVTVTGSGFTADSRVFFGIIEASAVTVIDASTLVATPAAHGAGSVAVRVENVNGVSSNTQPFTFDAPPTLVSVTPGSGTPLGGDGLTLMGTGFTPDTSVQFGGIAAFTVSVLDAQTLVVTTPAHAAGTVDIEVSNLNGSAQLLGAFQFDSAPTILSVSPNHGTPLGGTTVTVTGTHFTDMTSVTFAGFAATSVNFVDSETLVAVAPDHAPGTVTVGVANVNGSAALVDAFAYDAPPTVVSAVPNHGTPLGGETVVIRGEHFTPDVSVTLGGAAVDSVLFVSEVELQVVTAAHASGTVDIVVDNINGSASALAAFEFDPAPTFGAVIPDHGTPLGGDLLTISGDHFVAGTVVLLDGEPLATTVIDTQTLQVTTAPHSPGGVGIAISNLNGTAATAAVFTFDLPATVTHVTPAHGTPLGGDVITVSGQRFTADTVVRIDGTALVTTFVDGATLSVVTEAHAPGTATVSVDNLNGPGLANASFLFDSPPSLTAVQPATGSPLGGEVAALSGSGFTEDVVVTFGGISAAVVFVDDSTLQITTPPHAPGTVIVEISNLNGVGSSTLNFEYAQPPMIGSLTPNHGTPLGGDLVTLSGSNFTPSTTLVFGGVVLVPTFVDSGTLTWTTPAHAAGAIELVVNNENGSDSQVNSFEYDAAPMLVTLTPNNGSPFGGHISTATGENFTTDTVVTFDGVPAHRITFVSETTLLVTSPPHAPGGVDVVVSNINGSHTSPQAFIYNAPPVIAAAAPSHGTPFGGDTVTLSGTGFTADTTVSFDGLEPQALTFVDAETLIVTTPPHAAGAVTVFVSNVNGSGTLNGAFRYDAPPANVVASPNHGSPLGAQLITLNGTGFTPDTSVSFDGLAASVVFVDAQALSVTTPAHAPGIAELTLTNLNGASSFVGAFTFDSPPSVTDVQPDHGSPLGGEIVTVLGDAFTASTVVRVDGELLATSFVDASTLRFTTVAHAPGTVGIEVTNVNGAALLSGAFEFDAPPTVTAVTPDHGTPLGGETIAVVGSNFTTDCSVRIAGVAVPTTFVDSTSLHAITPPQLSGVVDIEVSNLNGSSIAVAIFTYDSGPAVVGISPDHGTPLGGEVVTLMGADFTPDSSVFFGAAAAASVSFVDSNTLQLVTPAHAPGVTSVSVTNVNGDALLSNGFTFDNAPSIVSVVGNHGSPLGGTVVTLLGADFTPATAVTFGGLAAASVTFVNANTLEVLTPPHAAGTVDLAVSNLNGVGTLSMGFTYDAPPTLSAVNPGQGTPLGGDPVTLVGTGFTNSSEVFFGGIAATAVTPLGTTGLLAVTPSHVSGDVDVTVTTINGTVTLAEGFHFNEAPMPLQLTPAQGSPLGGDVVRLFGEHFNAQTAVTLGGLEVGAITLLDSGELMFVTPPHAPGLVSLQVDNENGSGTLASAFLFLEPPVVSAITPDHGTPLGGEVITLVGDHFTPSVGVVIGGAVATSTFSSPTQLSVVTPPHASGLVDIEVSNENGSALLVGAFEYDSAPGSVSLSPQRGTPLGGDQVTLSGENFTPSTLIEFDGIAVDLTFVDSNTLTVVTPAHSPGAVTVTVTTINGSVSLIDGFTYDQPPLLTAVIPAHGTPLGGETVTLSGSNFTPSSIVEFDGTETVVGFINETTLTAVVPPHLPGSVGVSVSTENGTYLLDAAFLYDEPPVVSALLPSSGTPLGGTAVTISGEFFTPAAFVTFDGIAAAVTYVDAQTLEVEAPPHTPGVAVVIVVTENGSGGSSLPFIYDNPPTISAVTPNHGSPLGGEVVLLTGSDFTAETLVTIDGVVVETHWIDSTTVEVITPAHDPGDATFGVSTVNGDFVAAGIFSFDSPPFIIGLDPNHGTPLGGDMVTVTGVGFTADTLALLDGVAVSTQVVDSDTLIFTTEAHSAGVVTLRVENLNGGFTLPAAFSYDAAPVVGAATPDNGSPLGGESISLFGENFTADVEVFFDAVAAPQVTWIDSQQLEVVTPVSGAGSVAIRVVGINGEGIAAGAFTFNAAPTLTALTPNHGSPLGGETVVVHGAAFTAESTVRIAGVAVPVSFVDSGTLEVVTPMAAAGFVDVTVETVNGSALLNDGFQFDAPPLLLAVEPASGTPLGGDVVTLSGDHFTAQAEVSFDGVAASAVNFVDPQTLLVTTPAHAPGSVEVQISTVNGVALLAGAFSYLDPPIVTSIVPDHGSPLGGELVTLEGDFFTADLQVRFGSVLASDVVVISKNEAQVLTPASVSGGVDVVVENVNGVETVVGGFLFDATPSVLGATPNHGTPLGGDSVTVVGDHFTADSEVMFGDVAALSVSFVDSNTLVVTTPQMQPGLVTITVTTLNGSGAAIGAFTVDSAPVVVAVDPAQGSPLGGQPVTVVGENFTESTLVSFGGIVASSVLWINDTTLNVITPPLASGSVDVTATNNNGSGTLAGGFLVDSAPVVGALAPDNGTPLGGDVVTLSGQHFTADTSVLFGGVPATAVSFVDSETLIVVTPTLPVGFSDVTVSNVNGSGTMSGLFFVNSPPALGTIVPANVSPLGGTAVTLNGANFTAGTQVRFNGTAAITVSFVDTETLVVTTPPLLPGVAEVTVTTVNGSATLGLFVNSPPTIFSLTPDRVSPLGGSLVVIDGADFTVDTTVDLGALSAEVTFVSSQQLSVVVGAGAPGNYDVAVTNGNGTDIAIGALIVSRPPQLTSLTPNLGSSSGGTVVTLAGSDFTPGTQVFFGGVAASVSYLDSSTLTVVTPPFVTGMVDVRAFNANGESLLPDMFTYDVGVTTVSPRSGAALGGETIVISGAGFTASATVRIDGLLIPTTFVNSTTLLVTTPPHTPGWVDVSVTTSAGTTTLEMAFEFVQTLLSFQRGDSNSDGFVDVADAIHVLLYLFGQGVSSAPGCLDAADANDDGFLDISDATSMITFLFIGGVPPAPPFGACDIDPTPGDPLGCALFGSCP